jgi:hypothetical protein
MLPIKQYILGEYFLKREHEFMFVFSKYPKTKKKMKNMLIKGEFPPPKPIFKRGNSPTQIIKKGESPPQNPERGHSPRKRGMWQH